jgi:hypothetical protein
MDSKKLLSVENLILYAGVGFLAYWYFRKTPKAITIDPPLQTKDEPKTIVLDLRDTRGNGRRNIFSDKLAKDYNASETKTFAPARTIIRETNDL